MRKSFFSRNGIEYKTKYESVNDSRLSREGSRPRHDRHVFERQATTVKVLGDY